MKYSIVWIFTLSILLNGCKKKEKIEFTLNSLTLKSVKMENIPNQNLYLKVLKIEDGNEEILATTKKYPSEYTLPVKFGIENHIKMNFYKNTYAIALYGDSSGCIGTNSVNINDYKILYILDMDTENNGLGIVLSGTWR